MTRILQVKKSAVVAATSVLLSLVSGCLAGDLATVKERGVLRHLGVPYANFVWDSEGGLDVELVKLFAKHLDVKYEYVPSSWETVISDLTGKKYAVRNNSVEVMGEVPQKGDMIANGLTVLPLRQQMVDYSIPTFPTQIWLVARSDLPLNPIQPTGSIEGDIAALRSILKGYRLLGKANTCLDPALYNLEDTQAKIIKFDGSLGELVPMVLRGEADLSLLDMPDALIALQNWPGRIKILGPLSPVQEMACAFAKGNDSLRNEFNEFFRRIVVDGTYQKLVEKYYPSFNSFYPGYFKGAASSFKPTLP